MPDAYVEFELVIRGAAGAYTIELRGNDVWGPMAPQPFLPPADLPVLLLRAARCRTAAEQRSGVARDARPVPLDGGAAPTDAASEQDPLGALGRGLAAALFQGEVLRRYERALGTGRPLRIRLLVPPDLADVPWEVTKTADGAEFVALSRGQHIVRVSDAPRAPSTGGGSKLRVLALAATPKGLPGLAVDAEATWLKGALDPLVKAGRVDVKWIEGGREDELRRHLLHESWDVFHFAGHGEAGSISCCGPDGAKLPVTSDELARLLKARGIGLVVLNSCQGAAGSVVDAIASTARVLSERAVPAVVAMQYAISDESAVTFTRWFYEALAARKTLEEAVAEARDALAKGGSREWVTPVVYLNRADGVVLRDSRDTQASERIPLRPKQVVSAVLLGLGGLATWASLVLLARHQTWEFLRPLESPTSLALWGGPVALLYGVGVWAAGRHGERRAASLAWPLRAIRWAAVSRTWAGLVAGPVLIALFAAVSVYTRRTAPRLWEARVVDAFIRWENDEFLRFRAIVDLEVAPRDRARADAYRAVADAFLRRKRESLSLPPETTARELYERLRSTAGAFPRDPVLALGRCEVCSALHDQGCAEAAIRPVLHEANPWVSPTLAAWGGFCLSNAYYRLGQYDDAARVLENSATDSLARFANLTGIYLVQGKFARGRELAERGLRWARERNKPTQERGHYEALLTNHCLVGAALADARVRPSCDEAARDNPDNAIARWNQVYMDLVTGDCDAATLALGAPFAQEWSCLTWLRAWLHEQRRGPDAARLYEAAFPTLASHPTNMAREICQQVDRVCGPGTSLLPQVRARYCLGRSVLFCTAQ